MRRYLVIAGALMLMIVLAIGATAQDNEPILGCIVNTVYLGRTPEGIGIGSTAAALTSAYGAPDTLRYDPRPPAAWAYMYNGLSAVFFTDTVSARPIIEIHMFPFAAPGASISQVPLSQRAQRR